MPSPEDPLSLFSAPVAAWFRSTFGAPTRPQARGWPAIAEGHHALILAPTGSGKTLTAFLWSLDVLFRELRETPEPERTARRRGDASTEPPGNRPVVQHRNAGDTLARGALAGNPAAARTSGSREERELGFSLAELGFSLAEGSSRPAYEPGVRVVYISPLKALNNDVERNLDAPLHGIREEARRAGAPLPAIRVAVRTGDTPSNDRQSMVRRPPHVLITTPESLYLLLTSERASTMFGTVHTVIVDEIHTLVGTKRGAHLTVSLERLQRLSRRQVQRIGLSATVRPLENAARFLGGQAREEKGASDQGAKGESAQGEAAGSEQARGEAAGGEAAGSEAAGSDAAGSDAAGSEQARGERGAPGEGTRPGGAPRPVTIVDAGHQKALDLRVVATTDDFRNLPGNSIWTSIIPEVTRLIDTHRTTLVFCNSRRLAERTADRLNERRLFEKISSAPQLTPLSGGEGVPSHASPSAPTVSLSAAKELAAKDLSPSPLPAMAEPGGPRAAELPARGQRVRGLSGPTPRRGLDIGADAGMFAAGVDEAMLEAAGLQPIRAHHGSMSKAARLEMEQALKAGTLPALVATSSLELGIDIGVIDLVVHLQSPKSVASGLQRVGRSGHLVGQTSVGRIFTTHPEDAMEAAAVAWGMLHGEIERTQTPENPLDILAQHLMAMVSIEDWTYDAAYALVRCAYPFRNLSEAAFRSVVEMLAGKYPETVSRQLQARLSWDRVHNRLAALPGSRLLAIQSGGTIPDRGAYALVLADRKTKVGELDEEFVFETRAGDTFLLGSQVWRAIDIAEDRVIAEPAPGEVPRMPFWRGDYPWRAYDLGKRIGAFRQRLVDLLAALTPEEVERIQRGDDPHPSPLPRGEGVPPLPLGEAARRAGEGRREGAGRGDRGEGRREGAGRGDRVGTVLRFLRDECGLDRNSVAQVVGYVTRQLAAVGQIATDRSVIVETFEDAVGDPRLVVHSPFGGRVNGPWGLALAAAMREQLGADPQVITGDDGILLRFVDTDVQPPADLVARLTSREATERLLAELPNSAVFGAQFRMNAARALLLPRQRAGKRTPLWLTRLKAKDLLQAVQRFDDFPILLETYRDCLRDVMDLDGLAEVLDRIEGGEIQVTFHPAEVPSPLAAGLDYRLAMQYMYEYDAPRGEKQLAALSLDRSLLADLLQDGALADLLKPAAVQSVAARVSRTGAETRARSAEELAQVLYEQGDLSEEEVVARSAGTDEAERRRNACVWLEQLASAGRAVRRSIGGQLRWVAAERSAEYDDLAANPLPVLRRLLMHSGPTTVSQLAGRYGLPAAQVRQTLSALGRDALSGRFTPGSGEQWIDRRNLEQIHRQTLSLLRKEVRPVPLFAYAEFLRRWQRVAPASNSLSPQAEETGSETALNRVLQQLRGLAVPGAAWERDVLPARLAEYDPEVLAERCQSGEVMWVAEGGRDARRARVRFFFRGEGGLFLERTPDQETVAALSAPARAVYDFLAEEGAALFADVVEATELHRAAVQAALVELVLAGLVTNDTLGALRAVLGYEPPPALRPGLQSSLETQLAALMPGRPRRMTTYRWREAKRHAREAAFLAGRPAGALLGQGSAGWTGRWSLVRRPGLLGKPLPESERSLRRARQLLSRWGVVTKACLEREGASLPWEEVYPVLAALEMRGEVRRGYFVEDLPGVQFALPEVVEQLRAVNGEREQAMVETPVDSPLVVLSAADPAQLFGSEGAGGTLRFARVAASAVALHWGEPVAVMTAPDEAGAAVLAVETHPALALALRHLARWWAARAARPGRVKVQQWQGDPVLDGAGVLYLERAGFVRDLSSMVWAG